MTARDAVRVVLDSHRGLDLTTREIARAAGYTERRVRAVVRVLAEEGEVRVAGRGRLRAWMP